MLFVKRNEYEAKRLGNKHFYKEVAHDFIERTEKLLKRAMGMTGVSIFDMNTEEYAIAKDTYALTEEACAIFEVMADDCDKMISDLADLKEMNKELKKQNEYLVELLKEIKEQTRKEDKMAITVK